MQLATPDALALLEEKISSKSARVGIYGLGYVGLPLALRFAEVGLEVLGFDIDAGKVQQLNAGGSYIERLMPSSIQKALEQGFEATSDFARTTEVDALIICVPTPLNAHREPDLSFITDTIDAALPYMRAGQLVSLESTTWPGTTDEVLAPRLRAYGLKPGENCALVFSPEREDPGNAHYGTKDIPKIIGGTTPRCLAQGVALYQHAIHTMVPVSSTKAAEMTKLLENIHRSVNIGLVNEMKIVADKMGINIYEVIDAAATKPFGFVPYKPGPGLGGHCIPIDPFYLTWKAKEVDYQTKFIELAGEINTFMPYYVRQKTIEALNERGKSVKNAKVLVLGLAYKKDIDDSRESPSLKIISLFQDKGAKVSYNDPYIPHLVGHREYPGLEMKSVPVTKALLRKCDAVVISTDHTAYDYDMIVRNAPLVIDTRNAVKRPRKNVVKA